ncbi:hypothetical protein AB0O90_17110 [Microbacterium testaceum]|uniref:hypothetical protein n=1 Tax=Microbacterium testaceum TaxID=2033 RepID=UPI003431EC2B
MTVASVSDLVDQVLAAARAAHPEADFGITLSLLNARLLPRESERLVRGTGFYVGHVYSDCLVEGIPDGEENSLGSLIVVAPVLASAREVGDVETFYGDLRTGRVSVGRLP